MTDGTADDPFRALARDWLTIWQSELAAMASDREAQESWQGLVDLWAGAAGALLNERSDRRARPTAPPRPAPTPAAPDARDDEIQRLNFRVAELERQVAALEPGRRRGKRT